MEIRLKRETEGKRGRNGRKKNCMHCVVCFRTQSWNDSPIQFYSQAALQMGDELIFKFFFTCRSTPPPPASPSPPGPTDGWMEENTEAQTFQFLNSIDVCLLFFSSSSHYLQDIKQINTFAVLTPERGKG